MSEPDRFGLEDFPSIADVSAFDATRNGAPALDSSSWEPIDLAGLDETPPVQPTLGSLGFVYPGKRHVFSGPQESAKTLAAYVVGLEVVRSGSELVLIDFEMGPWDARTRLRELGASVDELRHIRYLEPDVPATGATIGALVERGPGLVVIDAVAGAFELHAFDDNRRQDVERFSRMWLQPFRKAGIATIVLDHVVKSADARGNYAIGSERKIGGADVHLGFEVVHPIKRGGKGVYKIVTHKDRGGFLKRGKLAEFELESDPDSHQIRWAFRVPVEGDAEHPFRPTVKMEQASKWLEKQMEEQVPMSHIEEGIGGNRAAGRAAIELLIEDGYFRESPGPRKARLMTLVKSYREEYDDLSPTSPDFSQSSGSHDLSSSPRTFSTGEVGSGAVEESSPLPIPSEDDDGIPF